MGKDGYLDVVDSARIGFRLSVGIDDGLVRSGLYFLFPPDGGVVHLTVD